jgi:hypothetical protein
LIVVCIIARPLAPFAGENAGLRSRQPDREQGMHERLRFKQLATLEKRLTEEAARLRREAEAAPPGIERERLVRRARQAETAAHMSEWLTSPGLLPPKQ